MPIFDAGSPAYQQTTFGTVCTQVWTNSPTVSGSAFTLTSPRDITLMNQGTAACYLTGGSVVALSGVYLPPGAQVTVQGTAQAALWAMTAAGSATAAAGLATTLAVV